MAALTLPVISPNPVYMHTFRFKFKFRFILTLLPIFLLFFLSYWLELLGKGWARRRLALCVLFVLIPLSYGNFIAFDMSCLIIFFFFIYEYFILASYLLLEITNPFDSLSFYAGYTGYSAIFYKLPGTRFAIFLGIE